MYTEDFLSIRIGNECVARLMLRSGIRCHNLCTDRQCMGVVSDRKRSLDLAAWPKKGVKSEGDGSVFGVGRKEGIDEMEMGDEK